jgi:type IV pilus assembly protein PilW
MSTSTLRRHPPTALKPRRGISLIELMVALVLGMLSVLITLQMFQRSDGAKRSALGGDDAQNSGALALTQLQRDLRHGGFGLAGQPVVGCDLLLPGGRTLPDVAPATINHPSLPAGDAGTDTLLVVHGAAAGSPEGSRIMVQPDTAIYSVAAPASFSVGDRVIATPATRPASCTLQLATVTNVVSPSPPNVTVDVGVAGMANGRLYNLGAAPRVLAYAVRGQQLTLCNLMTSDCFSAAGASDPEVWVPIGSQIVGLRAQYGRDTTAPAMDGVADVFDQTAPSTTCDWFRVSALRMVLVSRSPQQEREVVTTAAPTWEGSTDAPVDLSDLADWQNFRYRSFEALVPLRNLAWLQGVPGC